MNAIQADCLPWFCYSIGVKSKHIKIAEDYIMLEIGTKAPEFTVPFSLYVDGLRLRRFHQTYLHDRVP